MQIKHIAAGVAALGVLAGGGTMAADTAIDPYTTNGTKLEIAASSTIPEAGTDKAVMDTTKPKMTLEKWNGEVAMGVTYDGMQATGARPFLSKNVEWSDGNQTMQVVPLEASSTMEDGGYEINIILNAPPASNVFNFSIDNANQLDFFYQAPLWQEAGLKAPTKDCTDNVCNNAQRPENVVGSYAVYYKNHANHIAGQTNYATGKAYNIFRPLVTDANGATVWANMSYSNGLLTINVPQTFLDTAAYPVTIDPTFGYTSIGASLGPNASADRAELVRNTLLEAGNVTSMNIAAHITAGAPQYKPLIYDDDGAGGIPGTRIAVGTAASIVDNTFVTYTITATLSAGNWWIGPVIDSLGAQTKYDTDATYLASAMNSTTFASPASTWVQGFTDNSRKFSVYATYTATASSQAPLPEF